VNRRLAITLACIAGLALLPLAISSYQVSLATQMLIFGALAMSIDILAGYSGRTPLGHGAIFGVATYVVLYTVTVEGGSPWTGVALGILAATATAAVFGALATRTSGVYFLLLTLALGMIVWGICVRWTSVTGGENGIRGTVKPEWLAGHVPLYYFVLAVSLPMAWLMWRFVNSPFGLTLKGIRESESRMRALGYNVPLHLFIGFTVSGFFAGTAGALYAFFNSFVSPSTVELKQSVAGLLMAIVGGVGTLFGSLIGSAAIILLENWVSLYTERWSMVLGFMFIFTMIFAPEGLVGKARNLLERRRAKTVSSSH
jgi:branched-chain amino acid transport system permease protein